MLFFLGALTSLSLPPFNFYWINFFTFSILFIFLFKRLTIRKNKKIYFFYGWLFGFGYFITNLYWIIISLTFDNDFKFLIPIALILIPTFLALFYGLITLIFRFLNFKNIISAFFLFSLLFGLIEFIRGNILTGFPWNLIIYSFSEAVNFISFVSVVGTYSFNLLLISLFSAPSIYFLKKSKKEIVVFFLLLLMPILFLSYGSFYKQKFFSNKIDTNPYKIRIIGSNISLDRYYKDIQTEVIINELIELSSPSQDEKILFIWPEGIIPNIYLDELKEFNYLFLNDFNKNHLFGLGITSRTLKENKNEYFNSFVLIDSNLNQIQKYDKINLVPFGEFLPFENFLNKIGLKTITNDFGSFKKGDKREIFKINNDTELLKFLPTICYEIIYSGNLTEKFDFNFILNISEDGWFGKSIGPKQHFAHSVFRAVENGKYVIRSSNNGSAAIINPLGVVEKKIDYGKSGFIDFEKRRDIDPTLFSKYGNKIFIVLILLYIFLIISFNKIKNE